MLGDIVASSLCTGNIKGVWDPARDSSVARNRQSQRARCRQDCTDAADESRAGEDNGVLYLIVVGPEQVQKNGECSLQR